MIHHFRYAVRQLAKSPGFAIVSVLTLALGIGANIAVFSVTNAVLLNPSGIPHAANLVALRARYAAMPDLQSISLSAPDFGDAADGKEIFSGSAVMKGASFNFSRDNANPELLNGAQVSSGYFDVFDVRPALGRVFTEAEDQPGAGKTVVLSDDAWKRRFGSDPSIVGRSLVLNQQSYQVVGVMGPEFRWPNQAELWVPIALPPSRYHDQKDRYNENLFGVARLRPGVTLQQANAYLNRKAEESMASEGSGSFGRASRWAMFSVPLTEFIGGSLRKPLTVLLAAVGMVLLIACANIAGLQMARASARQRDLAVRVALGASRWKLIRQALAESVVLTVAGLVLGFVVAYAVAPLLLRGLPPMLADHLQLSFRGPVLLFVVVIAVLCSLLCGVVPAWHRTQPGWFNALTESGRSGTSGRVSQRARSSLVVVQVALSLVLLAGAGLLLSSLREVEAVDTGFQAYGLVSAQFSLPQTVYDKDEKQAVFLSSLEDRLRSIPGITSAALVDSLPFSNSGGMASFFIQGRPSGPNDPGPHGSIRQISPGYFSTLRVPLLQGREFTDGDRQTSEQVAIVDEVLARQYWPGQNPVGQHIGFNDRIKDPWFTIVGIAAHSRSSSLESDPNEGFYYLPLAQSPSPSAALLVRSARPAESVATDLAAAVRAGDSSIPIYDVKTMEERVNDSLTGRKFVVILLGTFAALALLLAALGLYGVISYSVRLRTRELGVRMALGAQRGRVLQLVLLQGLQLAAFGVVFGLIAAAFLGRVFSSLLFRVSMLHAVPWLAATAVLVATVLLASYLPARRAASIEPMKALRTE
ncbi:MAG TPA: ABC transporter permease [Terriglobales bacterium]